MIRTALVVLTAIGSVTALSAEPSSAQAPKFSSKQLEITGFSQAVSFNVATGNFHVKGAPVLHAAFPLKHMSLDAADLIGHYDNKAEALRDATLTGGVHGTFENKAKKGTNKIVFGSASAVYTDEGADAADINTTGGAHFSSVNIATGSKFLLKGSNGTFHLSTPANQEMSLQNADLDGPVTYSFAGIHVGKDQKSEPVSGGGTAGRLKLTRSGTDYVLYLSNGFSLKGIGLGFALDVPGAGAITVTIDESGNFKGFSSDDDTPATLTPLKKNK